MNRNKTKNKRHTVPIHHAARRVSRHSTAQKLTLSVFRSIISGISIAVILLCLIAAVFANTNLPLAWIGPAACAAAAVGTFVSGFSISHNVTRFRLLAGLGCGIFYCLCSLIGSFVCARVPTADSSNLSLLAVLLFGAVAGSAAGALRSGPAGGVH